MKSIHLQGMGLVGSLIAWQLYARGWPFTWSDAHAEHTAWKACTGCCYPASDENSVDRYCYDLWRTWLSSHIYPRHCFEATEYWFDSQHRALPHGLQADVIRTAGKLRTVASPSIHVNAQELVLHTRRRFAAQERPARQGEGVLIVSNGFARAERYLWGWTAFVELDFDEGVFGPRPCFYLRRNRFQFAYSFPRPGSDEWYAGSSLISQNEPRAFPMEQFERRFSDWKKWVKELTDDAVRVKAFHGFAQGWRPAQRGSLSATEGHAGRGRRANWVVARPNTQTLGVIPMASNGFRNFPELWRQLERCLNA